MTDFAPAAGNSPFLAVIGIACRFPGAPDVEQFWANLIGGVESITLFPGGMDARTPGRVPAAGILDGADEFDSEFFGYPPLEALLLDPQQRVLLECGWEALERAGYDPQGYPGLIGVYGGCSMTSHGQDLRAHRAQLPGVDEWAIKEATAIDYVTTRLSYKLGLTGPALTIQASCATSLAAIHVAGQALLAGECDMALAGGVTVHVPPQIGPYSEEAPLAADGHCRAFDADGSGTVGADGAGLVVLKRLDDAIADGDHVHAVLRGSAANNDGRGKVGFTAPSVDGQAQAVRTAHLVAGVDPATITYVEAHGTGTVLGDPIEVAGLTQAFRAGIQRRQHCWLGSVKTNIGHADSAAGVAGFIKAVLAVEHGLLPPSLNFSRPNPAIDFAGSPFRVNAQLRSWDTDGQPRRAGVSAFGIGGTNVHVVVEQPPLPAQADPPRPWELLILSAKTTTALDRMASRLADHLRRSPHLQLSDVAWTLQAGRAAHDWRAFAICADHQDASTVLGAPSARRISGRSTPRQRQVIFTFPGHGQQHVGMGHEIYAAVPAYRAAVDECCELALQHLGTDLRTVLCRQARPGQALAGPIEAEDAQALADLATAQTAIFVTEYALAQVWMNWGVMPAAVTGHSLGAYAAACIAGVFTLPAAIRLVIRRGQLLRAVSNANGAMLAVAMPEEQVMAILGGDLELAAVNGPEQCVVAGPADAINALRQKLEHDGVDCRMLHTSGAGHSTAVQPVAAAFRKAAEQEALRPPQMAIISDQTGTWLTAAQATDPGYWAAHLVKPVRFGDALSCILAKPSSILLETGPGQVLTGLARRHPDLRDSLAVPSLPRPDSGASELANVLGAVGTMWCAGTPFSWKKLHDGRQPRRVPLPTYPFERQRYTLGDAGAAESSPAQPQGGDGTPQRLSFPRPEGCGEYVPPISATQERLCRAFSEILGFGAVGIRDNFFLLGGDSLIASRLIVRVGREFQVRIPAPTFFGDPTVAGLAETIEDLQTRRADA